ncbi:MULTISPECIES: preprotein translocase subunit YajC [Bacillaceae]|jgi:preprotein translocase subunit YajC|uniref:Preprotein translocase subunit YajC n=1 Tax=Metabacillus hrfriensis TaxID=3048891 RepID=A0ACD4R895_9BACI|nr:MULTISPECIES: preprotein translocase subunit YajC [Bacillaceae]UOK57135.1 preprotein translocase subunit YajC [Bacillus sp. OVS6]USK27454.1 preprotein translocase subunit YajC [Bacillus sp. CMF21]MDQ0858246.1 preprotein translocase subunit YajC [Bacillus sp. V2I10]UAL51162.1 preprotein translocase subunit YajC [Metabacillus dongyingensis]WHZ56666.1 preprotein translocase subunit YajC [Metabacillus sp. CT-WN-B3]
MELLTTVGPLILMFAIFYFLLIRPQQKQQKKVREMQESLSKGDKVVTIGGMHGIVDSIDEEKVIIKAGDGSRLTFDRRAVRDVVEQKGITMEKA